jgi:hypothetical protein
MMDSDPTLKRAGGACLANREVARPNAVFGVAQNGDKFAQTGVVGDILNIERMVRAFSFGVQWWMSKLSMNR